jgi:hypothetical protein
MSSPAESTSVDRRLLLRGGAVLAGATVLAAAGRTPEASAADGDELVLGESNAASSSTTLTSTPAGDSPTLVLTNASGPTLRLSTVADTFEDGDLEVGDIANTDLGPVIGVDYGAGLQVDILATGADLALMPTPVALAPERVLDTRTAGGRASIVRGSSANPLTAAGKVKGGQWIDVAVESAVEDFALSAIFANITVVSPEGNGFASVYPATGGPRPAASTINYRTGESLANAVFVGLGVVEDAYVVRIYTAQTSHLIFDLSGGVIAAAIQGPGATARSAGGTKNRRAQRQAKQAARIKDSLRRS